jgi:hypothetical protein
MILQKVWVQEPPRVALRSWQGSEDEVNKEEIVRVLVRAADDNGFIARLTEHGEDALRGYNLTGRKKAALLSGDLGWIESHLGKLNARLRTWPECRLQQEIW